MLEVTLLIILCSCAVASNFAKRKTIWKNVAFRFKIRAIQAVWNVYSTQKKSVSVVRKYRNLQLPSRSILDAWGICISQSHMGRNSTVRIFCSHSVFIITVISYGHPCCLFFLSKDFNLIENLYYIFSESEHDQWQYGHFCSSVTASSSCEASSKNFRTVSPFQSLRRLRRRLVCSAAFLWCQKYDFSHSSCPIAAIPWNLLTYFSLNFTRLHLLLEEAAQSQLMYD